MRPRPILASLAVMLVAAYLATGWVVVPPGEVVVVRRLGRTLPHPWRPGPHLGWPFGFDRTIRIRLDQVRRLDVGEAGTPGADDEPGAGEYLTGDLNLVRVRGVVQYRVADPVAFALRASDVAPLLARLTEASLTRSLSRRGVDPVLLEGRAEVARDVESELSRAIERYQLGLAILGVSLTDTRPPPEVAPAFAAAQSARSERDRRRNEAATYQATSLPAARASAQARTEQARARAARAVAIARGRADRFVSLLAEARHSRRQTVRRIYLDALRDLLPRVKRKLVMTPEEAVDLSILGGED